MNSITNSQKLKIKELVDELIINRGVLNTQNFHSSIDGMNAQQLARLAFRYYRMIIKGESPLDVDLRFDEMRGNELSVDENGSAKCIGCNQPLNDKELAEKMPVCESCRKKIKVDFEILRNIFD